MIAWLSGFVVAKEPNSVVVSVQGVGYDVEMMLKEWMTVPEVGGKFSIHVHAAYREDAQMLFGFMDRASKQAFLKLNKVNGVGPKMALQILDTYSLNELSLFVSQGNYTALTRVKGVGPKVAKRLLIDLKGQLQYTSCPEKAMQQPSVVEDAIAALTNLGYKEAKAREMVQKADGMTAEEVIKSALQGEGVRG